MPDTVPRVLFSLRDGTRYLIRECDISQTERHCLVEALEACSGNGIGNVVHAGAEVANTKSGRQSSGTAVNTKPIRRETGKKLHRKKARS